MRCYAWTKGFFSRFIKLILIVLQLFGLIWQEKNLFSMCTYRRKIDVKVSRHTCKQRYLPSILVNFYKIRLYLSFFRLIGHNKRNTVLICWIIRKIWDLIQSKTRFRKDFCVCASCEKTVCRFCDASVSSVLYLHSIFCISTDHTNASK